MNAWTKLLGLNPVSEVLIQGTMAGPDKLKKAVQEQKSQLVGLASNLI